MSEHLPTVRVKRDGPKGYRIINLSAFDPAVHVLADETARPGDNPSTQGTAEAEVDEANAALRAAADPYPHLTPAQETALDGDGDKKPGGSLSKAEITALLKAKGVEFDGRASRDALAKILAGAEA
jgi:hypothetical protein